MTKIAATYPDAERAVTDYLTANLADGDTTVGVDLPDDWTTASPDHLVVSNDGTPSHSHPVAARPTIRLTAWSRSTTDAKALARRAQGVLCAHPGGDGIANVRFLTGEQPGYDPDHNAQLASATCRVTIRSTGIT